MTLVNWIVGPQLVGLIIFIVGLIGYYFPPKKINNLYGYRTSSSKKNQQTWDVANRFSAVYSIKTGAVILAAGLAVKVLGNIMFWPENTKTLLNIILLLGSGIFAAVFTIVATEKHLEKTFKD